MEGRRSGKEALYHLNLKASEGYPGAEQALKGVEVEPLSLFFKDKLYSAHYHGCLQSKICRASFSSTRTKTIRVGEVIHSDVCGPMRVTTPIWERYYVVFKNDFSGWCETKLLKKKSEVPNAFKNFCAKVEAETGKKTRFLGFFSSSRRISHQIVLLINR